MSQYYSAIYPNIVSTLVIQMFHWILLVSVRTLMSNTWVSRPIAKRSHRKWSGSWEYILLSLTNPSELVWVLLTGYNTAHWLRNVPLMSYSSSYSAKSLPTSLFYHHAVRVVRPAYYLELQRISGGWCGRNLSIKGGAKVLKEIYESSCVATVALIS